MCCIDGVEINVICHPQLINALKVHSAALFNLARSRLAQGSASDFLDKSGRWFGAGNGLFDEAEATSLVLQYCNLPQKRQSCETLGANLP